MTELYISEDVSIKDGEIILHIGTTHDEIVKNLLTNLINTIDKLNNLDESAQYSIAIKPKYGPTVDETHIKNNIITLLKEHLSPTNALTIMCDSGTAGSNINVSKITGIIGEKKINTNAMNSVCGPCSCDFDEDEMAIFENNSTMEEVD